jgi:hypothetical protein
MTLPWEAPSPLLTLPWDVPEPPSEDERKLEQRTKLRDFEYYRPKFLKIRPREGGERVPFQINSAQTSLHRLLLKEKEEFGMVRALIPKARRMGVSTYIGARYFHRIATEFGRRAQVVAHRGDSAANLHREIKEFYSALPPSIKPHNSASNAYELVFDILKSLYKVASADGGDIGRSDDFHLLHLSEAAFFDNTEDLSSGLLQTVQDLPGTEVVLESTGNGQSGMFYNMCDEAARSMNKGPWRVHFLPWSLMPEYQTRTGLPQGWQAPKEFEDYGKMHSLTREQLHWFWLKNYTISSMNGGQPEKIHRITRQEYPAIYNECFMADSTLDFFPASMVAEAMVRKPLMYGARKLLAVDAAGDGQDKPWVCDRQGFVIGSRIWGELTTRDANVASDWLLQQFRRYDMDAILIDTTGGYGRDLVAGLRLRMPEAPEKIISVGFSHGAHNDVLYGNRRAELFDKLQKLVENPIAKLPDDKVLQEDMASFKWGIGGCRRDEKARLFMTPKEKVRKEIGRSPDRLDCCVVSMAIEA